MKKTRLSILAILMVVSLLLTGCGKGGTYSKAMSLYEEGQFQEAAAKFLELGDYENSSEMVKACKYGEAEALFDAGSYEEAKTLFTELGDYENSAKYLTECDYNQANSLLEAGDYESAISIFETLGDFNDSAEKLQAAYTAIMEQKYGDVLAALDGNEWYFNGGSDTILNKISFSGAVATISQVSFNGNGKTSNGSNEYSFYINDDNIVVTMLDGSELQLGYALTDGALALDKSTYLTLEEIDAGLQGYWRLRNSENILGIECINEYNIYINDGNIISESAARAYGYTNGEYYYYGPEKGTYSLNFGGFDTNMQKGNAWNFNIIDGKPTVLHYDKVCSPSDKLPGENGYRF